MPRPALSKNLWSGATSTSTCRRSPATGTAPIICEPSTNTIAPAARARPLIAAMSDRWPVADCTPLKATSRVPRVDPPGDIVRLEPAVAEGDLADVVSLAGQQAPRVMVRAVLPLPDHHALTRPGRPELGGHQPGRRRHRRDQRDVSRISADQPGHRRPRLASGPLAAAVVQAVGCPLIDERAVGLRQPPARQADRSGTEVRPARGRREQAASSTDARLRRWSRTGHDLNLPRSDPACPAPWPVPLAPRLRPAPVVAIVRFRL